MNNFQIRCYARYMSTLLALICCPWRRHLRLSVKRTKGRTSSTTGTADSSNSHRTVATHSEELTLKVTLSLRIVNNSHKIYNGQMRKAKRVLEDPIK